MGKGKLTYKRLAGILTCILFAGVILRLVMYLYVDTFIPRTKNISPADGVKRIKIMNSTESICSVTGIIYSYGYLSLLYFYAKAGNAVVFCKILVSAIIKLVLLAVVTIPFAVIDPAQQGNFWVSYWGISLMVLMCDAIVLVIGFFTHHLVLKE